MLETQHIRKAERSNDNQMLSVVVPQKAFEDEFDPDEQDFIKRSDGSYWIRGKMPIYDLNEQLEFPLPESDEYDSIGGLVCSELGYIPVAGELFTLSTYEVKVQSSNQRQVLIVQLKPINMADNEIPSTS